MFLCSSSSCFKPCSSNHTYPTVARIPQVSCSSSILFLRGVGLLAYPLNTLSLRLSQFMQGKMLMRKIQENSYSHLLLFCFTESRLIIVLFFLKKKRKFFFILLEKTLIFLFYRIIFLHLIRYMLYMPPRIQPIFAVNPQHC